MKITQSKKIAKMKINIIKTNKNQILKTNQTKNLKIKININKKIKKIYKLLKDAKNVQKIKKFLIKGWKQLKNQKSKIKNQLKIFKS